MIMVNKRKWILIIVVMFILLSLSAVGYGFYQYNHLYDRIYQPLENSEEILPIGTGYYSNSTNRPDNLQMPEVESKTKPSTFEIKPFTLLIMGIDARKGEKSRSDSMIYTVVNPNQKQITFVPITRDIRVEIPGHGMEKMNHSMYLGGVPLVKKTVEGFVGIPIQRYITVDFEGFRKVIDEMGGIKINVPKRMKYTDPTDDTYINLQKGEQILDGKNALYYARYRRSDIGRDDTDEERSKRQIEVMKAVFEQGKEKVSLFNLFTFMNIAGEHIKTDLTKQEIEAIFSQFKHFSVNQIQSTSIHGVGKRYPYGKYRLYFLDVDDQERKRIKDYLQEALKIKPEKFSSGE